MQTYSHTGPTPPSWPAPPPPASRAVRLRRALARKLKLLWPPRPRLWAGCLAALVVGLGFHGLWFYGRLPARLPSELDWQAAAALLAREGRSGDAVVLAPPWAERARIVLPPSLPVMALPRYEGEDLVNVRRIWLLSLPRTPHFSREIERQIGLRGSIAEGPLKLGALELTRFDVASPLLPRAFLPDRLAGARVALDDRPCDPDGSGAFRCPAPQVRVSREVREIEYLPRPCIYAHPGPDSTPLTIQFREVPMGTKLRGHTGIIGEAMLRGAAPVRLTVKVGDQELGVAEEPPARPGWHPFQFDTTAYAGQSLDVTFTVTAADPAERFFCFDALTLP